MTMGNFSIGLVFGFMLGFAYDGKFVLGVGPILIVYDSLRKKTKVE